MTTKRTTPDRRSVFDAILSPVYRWTLAHPILVLLILAAITVVMTGFIFRLEVDVEEPGLVGPDRVLSAAAALNICKEACIVVDAGTATTVDFATPEDGFLGGAILPGRTLMAGALRGGTSRLPEVAPNPTENPLGTTTEGAIRAGVFLGWVGAVKELVRQLRERNGPVPVLVTGGDGRHLVAQLEAEARMVEGLVVRGIQLAWEQTRR